MRRRDFAIPKLLACTGAIVTGRTTHIHRTWSCGRIGIPKTKKSKAPVAMAPLLGRHLHAWRSQTVFAANSDWVFANNKSWGKSPRVGNMLVAHYLHPAAVKAGVLTTRSEKRLGKEGKEIVQLHYWDKKGNEVRRFGFHNLRHSPASFLTTKKKTDIKTVQRSLPHAKSKTTLDKYLQTDIDDLVTARELMLDAIFQNRSAAVSEIEVSPLRWASPTFAAQKFLGQDCA